MEDAFTRDLDRAFPKGRKTSWTRRTVARRAPGRIAYEASRAIYIVLRVSAPRARAPHFAQSSCKRCGRTAREPGHHRTHPPAPVPTVSERDDTWRTRTLAGGRRL